MENLGQLLKKIVRNLPDYWPGNKDQEPEKGKCGFCGLETEWIWLDSDCENLFPSRWMKHLCVCELVKKVAWSINQAVEQKDAIVREIENNPQTKKWPKGKIEFLEKISEDLEREKELKKKLLEELLSIKKGKNPNKEYLKKIKELTRKHAGWWILTMCKDEKEFNEVMQPMAKNITFEEVKQIFSPEDDFINSLKEDDNVFLG